MTRRKRKNSLAKWRAETVALPQSAVVLGDLEAGEVCEVVLAEPTSWAPSGGSFLVVKAPEPRGETPTPHEGAE